MATRGYTGIQVSLVPVKGDMVAFVFGPEPYTLPASFEVVTGLCIKLWDQAVEEPGYWYHWSEIPFPESNLMLN